MRGRALNAPCDVCERQVAVLNVVQEVVRVDLNVCIKRLHSYINASVLQVIVALEHIITSMTPKVMYWLFIWSLEHKEMSCQFSTMLIKTWNWEITSHTWFSFGNNTVFSAGDWMTKASSLVCYQSTSSLQYLADGPQPHTPSPVALQAMDIPLFSKILSPPSAWLGWVRMESSDILEELSVELLLLHVERSRVS